MPSFGAFKQRFSIFQPSTSQANLAEEGTVDSGPEESPDQAFDSPASSGKKDISSEKENEIVPPQKDSQTTCMTKCFQIFSTDPRLLALYTAVCLLLMCALPLLITYFIPLQAVPSDAGVCSVNDRVRFECFPDHRQVSDQRCDEWNCCWQDTSLARCYHRFRSTYRLNTRELLPTNASGHLRHVELTLTPLDALPDLPGYNRRYKDSRMTMVVDKVSGQRVRARLLLNPADESRVQYANSTFDPDVTSFDYEVLYKREEPRKVFTFNVNRAGVNYSLFSLNNGGGLVLSDNYTEATILLPLSCSLYGLGFGNHQQLRHTMTWTAWTLFSNYTDFSVGSALYGAHPLYLCIEKDGTSHGVFLNNSYLMEARLQPAPAVTFRTVGGDLDFHIVLGPRPNDVIAQLSAIPGVGRPAMPPYWALGYHVCPISDKVASTMDMLEDLMLKNIPFESSCVDADVWRHWLTNPQEERFDNFQINAKKLKDQNRKVMIVTFPQVLEHADDPENKTEVFKKGEAKDIYLKDSRGDIQKGLFKWESSVAFPDPTHPQTAAWMTELLSPIEASLFDGFLLHWNTPVDLSNRTDCPCQSSLNHPPFLPAMGMESISMNTLCMDVRYYSNDTHASMHNQYGRRHTQLLHDVLVTQNPNKRPFLVSLSTQAGSGAVGGHWGGEYLATWDSLKSSLVQVLEASLYSIPLSGVPIAGNTGAISKELWSRWFQLGAFYPLAISYYDTMDGDRHPSAITSRVHTEFATRVLRLRYSLLPYLYTLFYEAATLGLPVARAMFLEFPEEEDAQVADEQFMWGSSLLIVPCLKQNASTVNVWVPPGSWFEVYTGDFLAASSEWVQMSTPEFFLNIFLRSGHVIPMQNFDDICNSTHCLEMSCNSTTRCRQSNFTLLVGLDCVKNHTECSANGSLYLDDGESIEGSNLTISFTVANCTLDIIPQGSFESELEAYFRKNTFSTTLHEIRLYGFNEPPETIYIDNELAANSTTIENNYDELRHALTIRTSIDVTLNHSITWQ